MPLDVRAPRECDAKHGLLRFLDAISALGGLEELQLQRLRLDKEAGEGDAVGMLGTLRTAEDAAAGCAAARAVSS